jgi:hypothetical protein
VEELLKNYFPQNFDEYDNFNLNEEKILKIMKTKMSNPKHGDIMKPIVP